MLVEISPTTASWLTTTWTAGLVAGEHSVWFTTLYQVVTCKSAATNETAVFVAAVELIISPSFVQVLLSVEDCHWISPVEPVP